MSIQEALPVLIALLTLWAAEKELQTAKLNLQPAKHKAGRSKKR